MRRKIRELFLCTRKLAPRLGNSPSRLENQSTVGLGFPDTWHLSSTRSPKNAVTLVGPRKIWGFKLLLSSSSSSSGGKKTSSRGIASASGTMIDHNYGYHVIPVDHLLCYCMSKCKLTMTMDCMSEIKGEEKMCIDPNLEGFTSSHSSDLFFSRLQPKVRSIDRSWQVPFQRAVNLTIKVADFLHLITQIKAIFFRFWSSEKWTLIAEPLEMCTWCEINLLRIQLHFLIRVWNKKISKGQCMIWKQEYLFSKPFRDCRHKSEWNNVAYFSPVADIMKRVGKKRDAAHFEGVISFKLVSNLSTTHHFTAP